MRVNQCLQCSGFPCPGVQHDRYAVPPIPLKPDAISVILVSEAAPANPADYYSAPGDPLFQQTTVAAFRDAGVEVASVKDIVARGVYLTTAVKCAKADYAVPPDAIRECCRLLEKELALFPRAKALLLMGDVAIRAVKEMAWRAGEKRAIPAGSTYKLRGGAYFFRGMRAFPSYLQAGPAFFIEKSKRKMIAEDIAAALRLA